jgi:hypothetical protein
MSDAEIPLVMSATGAIPTPPATLRAQLLALVAAVSPGYTANLPASLIDDISSTDVGALTIIDQVRVDTINSMTPYGANAFLLNALGQIYGVQQGVGSYTSVYVVFSGSVGFVIVRGFTVSDGTHQYTVQTGGIIGGGGQSVPLFCVATVAGTWAVPTNTVTALVTSVPSTVTLLCTNPTAGVPGDDSQTEGEYRTQVLQAGLAVAQGMPSFLRTTLENVPGVQARLVSIRNGSTSGTWEIIVGGGDPYLVAYAIFTGLFDITTLVGSTLLVTGVTIAADGVYTTNLNHGFAGGETAVVSGILPSGYNGTGTVVVVSDTEFKIGLNTSGFSAYVSGGTVTPNLRNIAVSVLDYPDSYPITFVNPPQQVVSVTVTWNTSSPNIVSNDAVAQLVTPALVNYINSVVVGQPLNLLLMEDAFQAASLSLIPASLLTVLEFSVEIDGNSVSPDMGTKIIVGDPESYFFSDSSQITVVRG